jgi:hypothetical protein
MGVTISDAARNAACNAIVDLIDAGGGAGTLQIQKSDDTVLATLTFRAPGGGGAFGNAGTPSAGVAQAATITQDNATVAGTATKFRIRDSAGTVIITGTVGTAGADINFNSATFTAGGVCSVSALTGTMPAS